MAWDRLDEISCARVKAVENSNTVVAAAASRVRSFQIAQHSILSQKILKLGALLYGWLSIFLRTSPRLLALQRSLTIVCLSPPNMC